MGKTQSKPFVAGERQGNGMGTAWERHGMCESALRLPEFLDNRQMVVTSALHTGRLYPLPPGDIPGIHFCYRPSRPQGHSAAGRITSIKNLSNTIGNRTGNLPACR
jgi:hypothetical protein